MEGGDFPDAVEVASEAEVESAYARLADGLQLHIERGGCVLLAVMMGGLIPAVHLAGRLRGDFILDCCRVSRYRGGVRGGRLEWLQAPSTDLDGKSVLVVDDIYDEGITLEYVVSACRELGATRVVSAVLVAKRHDRAIDGARPDFIGLEVGDRYVFGCGMDYQHRWRHLPSIYALRSDDR